MGLGGSWETLGGQRRRSSFTAGLQKEKISGAFVNGPKSKTIKGRRGSEEVDITHGRLISYPR